MFLSLELSALPFVLFCLLSSPLSSRRPHAVRYLLLLEAPTADLSRCFPRLRRALFFCFVVPFRLLSPPPSPRLCQRISKTLRTGFGSGRGAIFFMAFLGISLWLLNHIPMKLYGSESFTCPRRLAADFLSNYIFLVVGRVGSSADLISQRIQFVHESASPAERLAPKQAETERIRRCCGRVFALRDDPEVCRILLPDCDSPGLAMALAFGHFGLQDFGLICVLKK